jgi:hypothetical protein
MHTPWDPLYRAYFNMKPCGPISARPFFWRWMACGSRRLNLAGGLSDLARAAGLFPRFDRDA